MLNKTALTPIWLGTIAGLLASLLFGFVYIVILHEPGTAFYWFALLTFLIGPLLAGVTSSLTAPGRKLRSFFIATGTVFGIVFALFICTYAFFIRVYTTKVQIPAFCDGTYQIAALPPDLNYVLPDGTKGIALLSDASTLIVGKVDVDHSPRSTTLFLINRSDGNILWGATFPGDIVAVAMDETTAYLFYQGLGQFINKHTGARETYILTMDTYGTNTDGFLETTGIISSWSTAGTVKSRPHLTFNGIAQGCYISGDNGNIVKL